MTRVTDTLGFQRTYITRTNTVTGEMQVFWDSDVQTVAERFNRADVTRNQKTDGQWRAPSSYFAYNEVFLTPASYHAIWKVPLSNDVWDITYSGISTLYTTVRADILNASYPSPNDQERALVYALNNVADRKASFAESLAEMAKTISELGDAARKIDNFILRAARKDWVGCAMALGLTPKSREVVRTVDRLRRSTGTMASAWLQYNFGIKPIVNDMVSMAAFLSDEGAHHKLRIVGKGRVAVDFEDVTSYTQMGGTSFGIPPVYGHVTMKRKGGTYVRLDYEIPNTFLRELGVFGLYDVPQAAWAVVPYSFLADWVLPVSEILKAYTASVGLNFKGGTVTQFAHVEKHLDLMEMVGGFPEQEDFVPAKGIGRVMNRYVYASDPKPTGFWIKDPFDAWKTVTSLALLVSRIPLFN